MNFPSISLSKIISSRWCSSILISMILDLFFLFLPCAVKLFHILFPLITFLSLESVYFSIFQAFPKKGPSLLRENVFDISVSQTDRTCCRTAFIPYGIIIVSAKWPLEVFSLAWRCIFCILPLHLNIANLGFTQRFLLLFILGYLFTFRDYIVFKL